MNRVAPFATSGSSQIDLSFEPDFALGAAIVRPSRHDVLIGGLCETLEPRVMQVLVALGQAVGQTVTRDELIDRCWSGRCVSDDAINRTISKIRALAQLDAGSSFRIETRPRLGYRLFVADSHAAGAQTCRGRGEVHSAQTPTGDDFPGRDGDPLVAPAKPSIAVLPFRVIGESGVLPFANMSGDPEQEYFSDGISEDIITDLSSVSALTVIARNTAFLFKGKAVDPRSVARQLNVSHVLEGSVRKAGGRVRINAQLVEGATGTHVWAHRYDRDLEDVFAIQDEISKAIVEALKLKLLPDEKKAIEHRATGSAEAYNLYLMARHCWNRGTQEWLERAVGLYSEALEKDPTFAHAHAGLADAFVSMGIRTYLDPKTAYARARSAALKALSINDRLADAHAALGQIAFVHDWDFTEAERQFSRAVTLDPSSVTGHHHYARLLAAARRDDEAIRHAMAAVALDPLSIAANVLLGVVYSCADRHQDSIAQLEKAGSLFPDEFPIFYHLSFSLSYAGRAKEAVDAAEKAAAISGRTVFASGALGYAKACAGAVEEACEILSEMKAAAAEQYVCPFDVALIHAALGDAEEALTWLEQAYSVRDHALLFINAETALAPLRHHPRFSALARKVKAGSE